ncbi:hypothetical protein AA309_05440 [Microvirga vignae]|uniref:Uncharacterized protein n=1 Tax=Microvirga vignae TaxID=1225564 RepID=A0A0H1RFE8_9HYPH|nr:hypothetical protein AA309_05440 [Microvirga vignae]
MTDTAWLITAVAVVAIIVVLVLAGNLGFINLTLFGNTGLKAGQHKPRATAEGAKAGRDIKARTGPGGEASANRSTAGRDVDVSSGYDDQR